MNIMYFIIKTVVINRKSKSIPLTTYYKATCKVDKTYIYGKFYDYDCSCHTKCFNSILYSFEDVIAILHKIDANAEIVI
jgi:hypothetical protein